MNIELVRRIADAVLYEGYVLYPYRPSSVKNRQRFNFGCLMPRQYSDAERGTERWTARTEVLVEAGPHATVQATVRFLHLVDRHVENVVAPSWQEGIEREVSVSGGTLACLAARPVRHDFAFPVLRESEIRRGPDSTAAVVIVRRQSPIDGAVELSATRVADGLFRVTVRIENTTPMRDASGSRRDDALLLSLASAHSIVSVAGGSFVSLFDPPEAYRDAVAGCEQDGLWPVMAGAEGDRDAMLASPIILYDYPQIAPESAGDLFDGTEIDEILTLRILTLTDAEKDEMRDADDRARQLLERTESMPPEELRRLHGTLRNMRPVEEPRR